MRGVILSTFVLIDKKHKL